MSAEQYSTEICEILVKFSNQNLDTNVLRAELSEFMNDNVTMTVHDEKLYGTTVKSRVLNGIYEIIDYFRVAENDFYTIADVSNFQAPNGLFVTKIKTSASFKTLSINYTIANGSLKIHNIVIMAGD